MPLHEKVSKKKTDDWKLITSGIAWNINKCNDDGRVLKINDIARSNTGAGFHDDMATVCDYYLIDLYI